MTHTGKMDPEMLSMVMDTIDKLERERLPLETKLALDHTGEFPMDLIRFMLGPDIALHLIFIPEEYGGLGAGATEIALVSDTEHHDIEVLLPGPALMVRAKPSAD